MARNRERDKVDGTLLRAKGLQVCIVWEYKMTNVALKDEGTSSRSWRQPLMPRSSGTGTDELWNETNRPTRRLFLDADEGYVPVKRASLEQSVQSAWMSAK